MQEIVRQISWFRCKLGHRKMTIFTPIHSPSENQLLQSAKHPSLDEIVGAYHGELGNRNETCRGGFVKSGGLARMRFLLSCTTVIISETKTNSS